VPNNFVTIGEENYDQSFLGSFQKNSDNIFFVHKNQIDFYTDNIVLKSYDQFLNPVGYYNLEGELPINYNQYLYDIGINSAGEHYGVGIIGADFEDFPLNFNSDNIEYRIFKLRDPELTSIEEINSLETHVYPNPTSNTVYVESKNQNLRRLEIYNELGIMILDREVDVDVIEIDLQQLSDGIYFIKLISTSNEFQFQKLTKVR